VIYHQLVDSLSGELKPEGILQDHLVLKIANALWRYQRVINAETCTINRQLETTADHIQRGLYDRFPTSDDNDQDDLDACTSPYDCAEDDIGTARSARSPFMGRRDADILGSNSMPSESHRETLQRYEMRLDRQLTRAFHLLHLLQHPKKNKKTENKPISDNPPTPPNPMPDTDNPPPTDP
jgi:hypothetical protein